MNWCFWLLIALVSPVLHASTSVLAGPHWWRETAELPSSSPPYALQGKQAWFTGQAIFSGAVIVPSCLVSMDNAWQSVSLRETSTTGTQRSSRIYDTPFTLQFHDCDLINATGSAAAGSRVKVKFYRMSKGRSATAEHHDANFQVVDPQGAVFNGGDYIPGSQLSTKESSLKYNVRFAHDNNDSNKNVTVGVLLSQE